MKHLALALAALLMADGSRAADPNAAAERAVNNFAHELVNCAAFYSIGAEGARRAGQQSSAERGERAAQRALDIARYFNEPEALDARFSLYAKQQAELINHDYANLAVLLAKYGEDCRAAVENPRARLLFWLSQ